MSEDFELHPRLAADSVAVTELSLSEVRLVDDARYPWVLLIPRRADLRDLHDLSEADADVLTRESRRLARAMVSLFGAQKMNVAALGNMVPQLHVHHVARFDGDPAWPGAIWGVGEAVPYEDEARAERIRALREALRT